MKNGRFRAFGRRCPMKKRAANDKNLHTWYVFVHVFCSNFAAFCVSVSTPNFQKSTPNFSAALTFENQRRSIFSKNQSKRLISSRLANPLKNGVFFAKKYFCAEFLSYGGPKMGVLSISFKKIPAFFGASLCSTESCFFSLPGKRSICRRLDRFRAGAP